ncbi:MAG: pyruvate kinase [Bacilli bacterium]|jgi:pyruvate kinase|nr:pyruvate kinase [Bacilli bacterium]MCH4210239.1 pyruvate kinase [Bacilli bacterium]MCH4228421.1 pyruvate kinase [Bacilli bacterium]MCH4278027.1 pyruvate kinase [Bacilli bacterium]MCI2055155.1 pyruvate kinase [Bacilli bacterium]
MDLNLTKKTKIVCTIGPASETPEMIYKLYKAGMNVMRVNFSHGTHEEQLAKVKIARSFEKKYGIYIPVALDTKGPEIRTGYMENGLVPVKKGQVMRITKTPMKGNDKKFYCTYTGLYDDVKIGDIILIDDGNLEMKITDKDEANQEIVVEALNDHYIKDQKGMNVPMSRLSMPYISAQDEADLKFGCENDMDAIFASFCRRPEDVLAIRAILTKYGKPDIPVIPKIENPEGVEKIEEIAKVADGIMVARGDLGDEIPPEEVPLVQRRIIQICRKLGKPVITATQMLDSMTSHPRPTRAEVSDVATAIDESSDCVMLSGESASGQYPVESVKMQAAIAKAMEKELPYESLARQAFETSEHTVNDAIANSIANTALLIGAKLIVNFTQTGNSTRRISKARPCCPIISVTNNRKTALRLALNWGVYSVLIKTNMPDFIEEMEVLALKCARDSGIEAGSPIIIAGGTPTGAGKTNFMRIVNVNAIKDLD